VARYCGEKCLAACVVGSGVFMELDGIGRWGVDSAYLLLWGDRLGRKDLFEVWLLRQAVGHQCYCCGGK